MPPVRDVLLDTHARSVADVVAAFATHERNGLTKPEVATRLATFGRNELPQAPPRPWWRRLATQFASPLVLLLLAAAMVSIGVWWLERHAGPPFEAMAILAIVLLNGLLGYAQEARAERAVASLRRMSAASACVVRDGERATIPAAELVPGDLVVLEEGMTVPADARVAEAVSLRANEAALTGESVAVSKLAAAVGHATPLARTNAAEYIRCRVATRHGFVIR